MYPNIIYGLVSKELNQPLHHIKQVDKLFSEGATIPFLSRYRKEATGGMDEVLLSSVQKRFQQYEALLKRKTFILDSIKNQGKLTGDLEEKIKNCWTETALEDLYLPYKTKRKTRSVAAIEKGLEPLAKMLMSGKIDSPENVAGRFVGKEVPDTESALQGARDIIAEWINEHGYARKQLRRLFRQKSILTSKVTKGKTEEGIKYKDYFDYTEPWHRIPSHRALALLRGEAEGVLKIAIAPSKEAALAELENIFNKNGSPASEQITQAIKDSYKRLLHPSLENELRASLKEKADKDAIHIFADNLRQLLLAPPLGQKRILAIDPGFRTGCKVVCLDETGNLLHNETIFPHPPKQDVGGAIKKIRSLVSAYKVEAIAIGNGTAGRETENFIQNKIRFDRDIQVFSVNESGASIYSASSVAREEFPQYDVTVRGAVSIGRRLADPLAELVKIDPKSIGVGQYQHDVNQQQLKQSLDEVVLSCVNSVGVNVNTASKYLLTYVSGIGPQLADNIIKYRETNGSFSSRSELKKVPRLGDKAYEQSAGFLRIPDGENPLDNTAVHPESYRITLQMAKDLKLDISSLIRNGQAVDTIQPEKYQTDSVGIPTLKDILQELKKPARDPRDSFQVVEFSNEIRSIDDLTPGMILPGIVTNITHFGAFVDLGIKVNGLIHSSQLADRYVQDPHEIVKIHQPLKVKVLEIDKERKRIQLSLKGL